MDQNTPSIPVVPQQGEKAKSSPILIVFIILFALLAVAGFAAAGLLYFKNKEDKDEDTTTKTSVEVTTVAESDEESDLKTYSNDELGLSFVYPTGWTNKENEEGGKIVSISATKGRFVWELFIDPIFTGGGYGYFLEAVAPAKCEAADVVPGEYDCTALSCYYDAEDLTEAYGDDAPDWNFGENAWGGTVIFDEEVEEYKDISGIGLGVDMHEDISGDFFSITYRYEAEEDDYSDLPHFGDLELKKMLETMDTMTNSFKIN